MPDDVLVILHQAIAKEEDRYAFYADAAAETTNPLAKRTFEFLAADELKHKQYLQAYYDRMRDTKRWPSPEECGVSCALEVAEIEQLFEKARADLEGALAPDASLSQVYDVAIKAEQDSIDFYSGQLENATSEDARTFYAALVKAERLHLKLVSETKQYLDDTEQWYFEAEGWIVEG